MVRPEPGSSEAGGSGGEGYAPQPELTPVETARLKVHEKLLQLQDAKTQATHETVISDLDVKIKGPELWSITLSSAQSINQDTSTHVMECLKKRMTCHAIEPCPSGR